MAQEYNELAAHAEGKFDQEVIAEIKRQLSQIHFGSLEISVHNGQVVQLERREKKRWGKSDYAKGEQPKN